MTQKQKTYGLVLDLGGAGGWHSIPDLGLMFHPEIPVPVGGGVPGRSEPSLEQAKAWDKDPGMPLKLVEVKESELPELQDAALAARRSQTREE